MKAAIVLGLFAALGPAMDLEAVKAEPNLEKRSEKALVYAGELLTEIRRELDASEVEKIKSQLKEFDSAVELSIDSLEATGKNARKSPKWFKRAEVRLRELNRRLETLSRDMSVDDRHLLESVTANVTKKIDDLVRMTLRGS